MSTKKSCGWNLPYSLNTDVVIIVNESSFIGLFIGKSSLYTNLIFFKSFPYSTLSPPLIVSISFLISSQTSSHFFKSFPYSTLSPPLIVSISFLISSQTSSHFFETFFFHLHHARLNTYFHFSFKVTNHFINH